MNRLAFLRSPGYWLFVSFGPLVWLLLYWLDISSGSAQASLNHLFLLIIVYPAVEELAFRGALQGWLRSLTGGRPMLGVVSQANLLTSIVFSLAHLFYQPWMWAMLVFLPSLIFGICRDRYQSVVPGMWLHMFYNAGFFLLLP